MFQFIFSWILVERFSHFSSPVSNYFLWLWLVMPNLCQNRLSISVSFMQNACGYSENPYSCDCAWMLKSLLSFSSMYTAGWRLSWVQRACQPLFHCLPGFPSLPSFWNIYFLLLMEKGSRIWLLYRKSALSPGLGISYDADSLNFYRQPGEGLDNGRVVIWRHSNCNHTQKTPLQHMETVVSSSMAVGNVTDGKSRKKYPNHPEGRDEAWL